MLKDHHLLGTETESFTYGVFHPCSQERSYSLCLGGSLAEGGWVLKNAVMGSFQLSVLPERDLAEESILSQHGTTQLDNFSYRAPCGPHRCLWNHYDNSTFPLPDSASAGMKPHNTSSRSAGTVWLLRNWPCAYLASHYIVKETEAK